MKIGDETSPKEAVCESYSILAEVNNVLAEGTMLSRHEQCFCKVNSVFGVRYRISICREKS